MASLCLFVVSFLCVTNGLVAHREQVLEAAGSDPSPLTQPTPSSPPTPPGQAKKACPGFSGTTGPALNGEGHGQFPDYRGVSKTTEGRYIASTATDSFTLSGPNPRVISNAVGTQTRPAANARRLSACTWWMGQLLDHDIALTFPTDNEPITVATNSDDVTIDVDNPIVIDRFQHVYSSDSSGIRKRISINFLTHFIDAGFVYGSDSQSRSEFVRSFQGGKLATQFNQHGEFALFNSPGVSQAGGQDARLFLFGEERGNENAALAAAQTLWLRNHNYHASLFASCNPSWTDRQLFTAARRMNIAEWQSVVYEDFLPALLGANPLPAPVYNANTDSRIYGEIAGAAYRIGHTLVNNNFTLFNASSGCAIKTFDLASTFFDPTEIIQNGLDHVALGITRQQANEVDTQIVDALRNHLFIGDAFTPPPHPTLDLLAINIARGRELGLPTFAALKNHFLSVTVSSMSDISTDPDTVARLTQAYGAGGATIVDPWPGLMAEDHFPGASVGPTIRAMFIDQFSRLRNGDAYYYEFDSDLDNKAKLQIKQTRLRDIILRNTNVPASLLPTGSVFFVDPSTPATLPGASC